MEETLIALKDSKRFVELKFQNYLQDRSKTTDSINKLKEESELLQVENMSLREHINTLEAEEKTHDLVMKELQAALQDKTRECEARMRDMQQEVSHRLDEINITRHEDKEVMRLEFAGLFDEKAGELLAVREQLTTRDEELESSERKISDLEYREQELNQTISNLREKYDPGIYLKTQELMEECSKNTEILQTKLVSIKEEFEASKCKYSGHVDQLTKEICDMKQIIHTKDAFIRNLEENTQAEIHQINDLKSSEISSNVAAPDNHDTLDNSNDGINVQSNSNALDNIGQDSNNNKSTPSTLQMSKRKRRNQKRNQKKNSIAVS